MTSHKFTVLIPVYIENNYKCVKRAINSILHQTLLPNEILIVVDGRIRDGIKRLLNEYKKKHLHLFTIVYFNTHQGLGVVLNKGVELCKYDIIARMDADDYSLPNRFEEQINVLLEKNCDIVGSYIGEFHEDIDKVYNVREVPSENSEILKYSKKRNPMNHMTVMFKKDSVIKAGSYASIEGFEDYYLWSKMLIQGFKFYNINQCLVLASAGDNLYHRRGGVSYVKNELYFEKKLLQEKHISFFRYLRNIITRIIVRILPNKMRNFIYIHFLRKKQKSK